jgi:hypothetical protein
VDKEKHIMAYKLCLPADQAQIAAQRVLSFNPPQFVTEKLLNHALGNVTDQSVADAARILEVGKSTLGKKVAAGNVPAYKLPNGAYRVQLVTA